MKGHLLTNSHRFKRHMAQSMTCSSCTDILETTLHALRDCPKATAVWQSLLPPESCFNFFTIDLQQWIHNNLRLSRLSSQGIKWPLLFGITIWQIWKGQNNLIFEKHDLFPSLPIQCRNWAISFNVAQQNMSRFSSLNRPPKPITEAWKKPPTGRVKLNVDAAVDFSLGKSAAGGIIKDEYGMSIGCFHIHLRFCSPLFGELWGILYGLKWSYSKGFRKVLLETDSLLAIHYISRPEEWTGRQPNLLREINQLLHYDWEVTCSHIYREANGTADLLAKMELKWIDFFLHELQDLPSSILKAMYSDNIGSFNVCNSHTFWSRNTNVLGHQPICNQGLPRPHERIVNTN